MILQTFHLKLQPLKERHTVVVDKIRQMQEEKRQLFKSNWVSDYSLQEKNHKTKPLFLILA